jgi:heme/copper-type cytochrome/quinol oxidase subunit 1
MYYYWEKNMSVTVAILITAIVCFVIGGVTGYEIHKVKVDMEAEQKQILGGK